MARDWSPISRQTVARRKSSQTIFPRRSKIWFDFPWASSFISAQPGGKCSRGLDAWRLPDYLKLVFALAKKNNKRVGLRVQMCAPDYTHEAALPDFVLDKVPKVDLVLSDQESSASAQRYLQNPHSRYQPRYDHPFFQQAFKELVGLLAAEFDGNPLIEFIDTFMYGFWGEGHTWPFGNNPFPDYQTAERTWTNMLEVQLEHFSKTPLLTNTQPDYSRVGNSELVDRTVRSNNWIRSDTIFIENEQIEALSNRPPWIAALLEQGLPGKPPDSRARL